MYSESNSVQVQDLAENLFPESVDGNATLESSEEVMVRIPGAIVHLIDKERSVELANGEFSVVQLKQGDNVVAALARVGNEIQWPLAKDEAAVKLDDSHYFFTLRVPSEGGEITSDDSILNYGLTIGAEGQEGMVKQLDRVLETFSAFRVEKAEAMLEQGAVEERAAAYWTTLAPNVEDYSGKIARMIAAGSGQVIRGILWCGDVTVDRLKWGNDMLMKRMGKASNWESGVSPQALRRMKRVKKLSKMTENVASGILSGVVKVSGFFTSSIANSKMGEKFFSLLPGEIVLASLEGYNKVFDAVEVAGKNVMSTTSVVTTGLVSQRYGEEAGEVTGHGLGAAGHAIGTAWAVLKITRALNPKTVIKPTSLVKAKAATSNK